LPTVLLRIVLEILQLCWTLKATALATRGTFGLIRSATIPLVPIADLLFGDGIGPWMLIGITLIFSTLVILESLGILSAKD